MRHIIFLFLFFFSASLNAQVIIDPSIVSNDSVPEIKDILNRSDLDSLDGDTILVRKPYILYPFKKFHYGYGLVKGEIYCSFSKVTYCKKEVISRDLVYYFPDYENFKSNILKKLSHEEMEKETSIAYYEDKDRKERGNTKPEKLLVKIGELNGDKTVTFIQTEIPESIILKSD